MVRTVGTHTKLAILIQFFLSSPIHAHAFSMSEEGLCSCLSTLGRIAPKEEDLDHRFTTSYTYVAIVIPRLTSLLSQMKCSFAVKCTFLKEIGLT